MPCKYLQHHMKIYFSLENIQNFLRIFRGLKHENFMTDTCVLFNFC